MTLEGDDVGVTPGNANQTASGGREAEVIELDGVGAAAAGTQAGVNDATERRAAVTTDASGVDEDPSSLTRRDEANHSWRFAGTARHRDEIVDGADLGSTGIEQWELHHPEGVDQIPGHARNLPVAPVVGDRPSSGGVVAQESQALLVQAVRHVLVTRRSPAVSARCAITNCPSPPTVIAAS